MLRLFGHMEAQIYINDLDENVGKGRRLYMSLSTRYRMSIKSPGQNNKNKMAHMK